MSTEIVAPYTVRPEDRGDLFWDPAGLRHGLELAGTIAASGLVPKHFQGRPADVLIALQIAHRSGRDPWTVLQSIYVVGGRPGWAATYLIALATAAGFPIRWRVERREQRIRFRRLQWDDSSRSKVAVDASMPDLTVTAYSPAAPDDSVTVDSQTAIDEGWATNPKYSTLGEQMLRYRAATLLVRLYHPHLLLGIPTVDELEDIAEPVVAEVVPAAPVAAPAPTRGMAALRAAADPAQSPPPPSSGPTSGSSQTEASGGGQEDPTRRAALARLAELRRDHADLVAEVARADGLTSPGKAGTERLLALIAEVDRRLARPAEPPTDATLAAIGDALASLPEDVGAAVAREHGIDDEVGPTTEEQAARYLAALRARVAG